ncbi:MAG: hypothetical protein K6B14_01340 [Lachnospiraceae bacterium]|nr:hypothetical protein [Lachnospiraceae bacterium]
MAEKKNVVKFHRQIHINIAGIICFIIFIYIVFHIYTYMTSENISIYEVKQGTIVTQNHYQALALRKEKVYDLDQEGHIYYLAGNKTKVSKRSPVYILDQKGDIVDAMKNNESNFTNLDHDDVANLEAQIRSYINDYDGVSFYKVNSFKTNLADSLAQMYNQEAIEAQNEKIESAVKNGTFFSYKAKRPGLVVYSIDGYENVNTKNFTAELFDSSKLNVTNLRSREKCAANEAAYKLITSEKWNMVIPIGEETAEVLKGMNVIEIEFSEDNARTWCTCKIREQAGAKYLILSLDDSMERYADSRFIPIDLLLDERAGLKIPNSSIVKKTFFTVPRDYFFRGNDKKAEGLLKKDPENGNTFLNTTIYYETDDCYYIDSEYLTTGDQVIHPDSGEIYTIGADTAELSGVYNVNKGYTVFKQIEIIYQNEDYTIVKTGTDYGIALYDRIVLQGDRVKENDVLR